MVDKFTFVLAQQDHDLAVLVVLEVVLVRNDAELHHHEALDKIVVRGSRLLEQLQHGLVLLFQVLHLFLGDLLK